MSDWNANIITEFRANDGKVGGMFEGATLLLLHHTGARSGTERVAPLMYQQVDDGYAIFASRAGDTKNPDWYYNLLAHPATEIEVGTDTVTVQSRVTAGDERERIWTKQKLDRPQFAEYETTANREIPVLVLAPRS